MFETLNDTPDHLNKQAMIDFLKTTRGYSTFLSFGVWLFFLYHQLKEQRNAQSDLIRARCLGLFKQNLLLFCCSDIATEAIELVRHDPIVQKGMRTMMDLKGIADDIEALVWQAVAAVDEHGGGPEIISLLTAGFSPAFINSYQKVARPYVREFLQANKY